jgi:hypothetical protein
MKTIIIAIVFACVSNIVLAQVINRTYQDSMGREVGRSATDARGNTTTYDAMGRETSRATTSNGTTTITDPMGRQVGTIRSNRK